MKKLMKLILVILSLSMLAACALTGCKRNKEDDEEETTEATENSENENTGSSTLIIYPEFDKKIERDYMYSVSVTQGDTTAALPVYNHTEDSNVSRNALDSGADEYRRFSTFAFDTAGGGVRVDIKVNRDFDSYSVLPSAKKFETSYSNGVISVFLDKPEYFLVRLDGKDSSLLAVLADAPETDVPENTNDKNVIIIDGWKEYPSGVLELSRDNMTVYLKPGSVLNARIRITGDNCKIYGRGAVVDPIANIYKYDCSTQNVAVISAESTKNTVIDGIHILDAKAYNVYFQGTWEKEYAENTHVSNVKALSTQMSSDGIAFIYYNKEAYAERCFVYCGDNTMVYEDNVSYKDMTVGTTCNALYPQTDVTNSSAVDTYVFRADEGIINHDMTGSKGQTLINHSIKNLYANDVTFTPYFISVEEKTQKYVAQGNGTVIENVYLPKLTDTRTTNFYKNENDVSGSNYLINMKNVSVGGVAIDSISTANVGANVNYTSNNTLNYSKDAGFNPVIKPIGSTVNYKNPNNIFVGKYQVYFTYPVVEENGAVLVPYDQIRAELRTTMTGSITDIDGIAYVNAKELASFGMAKSVEVEGNSIIITPNENSENLLLPDSGIISKYTENVSYAQHLVVVKDGADTVYRTINNQENGKVGIFRSINEELKKYGEGNYRLTFSVKAASGSGVEAMALFSNLPVAGKSFNNLGTSWTECTFDFSVNAERLEQDKLGIQILVADGKLSQFDVKNIVLVKVS